MMWTKRALAAAAFAAAFGLSASGALLVADWAAVQKGGTTVVLKTEVLTVPQQMFPMPLFPQIRWREYDV